MHQRGFVKVAALMAAFANLVPGVCLAQSGSAPALEPTALEAFAKRATSQIIWSGEAGRMDSDEAHVVVVAVVVRDGDQRMRGVRIDLSNRNAKDSVYLEQDRLERTKAALDEIAGQMPFDSATASASRTYHGAEEFWHPLHRIHALNAAYYVGPDWSGLSLSAFGREGFSFPGQGPAQLSSVLERALDQLSRH